MVITRIGPALILEITPTISEVGSIGYNIILRKMNCQEIY